MMDCASKIMAEKSRTNGPTKCKSQSEFVDDIINLITEIEQPKKIKTKVLDKNLTK